MVEIDREFSWLDFNIRVLYTASQRQDVPLLEKFNFLGITETNLTEFISVRLSNIFDLMKSEQNNYSENAFEIKFEKLSAAIFKFKLAQRKVYRDLIKNLDDETNVIFYDSITKIPKKYYKDCEKYFDKYIFPALSPMAYDATKELPSFSDSEVHYFVKVSDNESEKLCFVNVPSKLNRVVQIDSSRYVLIDEIITYNLQKLFLNKKIKDIIQFKTYRFIPSFNGGDINEFVPDRMRRYLVQRDILNSIMFLDTRLITKGSESLVKKLSKIMDINKNQIFVSNTPLWLNFMSSKFYRNPELEYKPFTPSIIDRMIGGIRIMKYIQKEDLILHHPYDSFKTIIELIREAADDENTISIKQTLYRVSDANESELIYELCRAAKKGKKVTVLIELKARFSEKNNIELIEKLKNSGVNIVYGFDSLKVHCKMLLITVNGKKGIKLFSQIGTGNYNENTSKIYTDISLLTSDEKIGMSLHQLFNFLSGFSSTKKIDNIYISPKGIRKQLEKLIEKEMKAVKKGKKSYVFIKVNSICDSDIVKLINKAANKGVKFNIICRGVCSLMANKNITIKSVVGRFLEHSRIYIFKNGEDDSVLIGSADLMTRNLDNRVELLVPVKDKDCREKIINIFKTTWHDTANSFIQENGKYIKMKGNKDCHKEFIKMV